MKMKIIVLAAAALSFNSFCYSQITKEVLVKDSVQSDISISTVGMYSDSKVPEAKNYFTMASEFSDKEDYPNAKKYYTMAIQSDPKYIEAYDNLGLTYRKLGQYDKAMENYNKSIELYPGGHTAHQNLAAIYGIKKQYQKAIDEYQILVKLEPNDPEGYFGIANSSLMLSQFDTALENAKKALELYTDSNSPYVGDGQYVTGLIYFYKGDTDNAKKYLKAAKKSGHSINQEIAKALKL